MTTIQTLLQYLLHIDAYLLGFVATYGALTYFLLFAIIFCETGLVVFPFLPGDSLLFTAGSIAASATNDLKIESLFVLLVLASVLGNKLNYMIGKRLGPAIFENSKTRLLNKKHFDRAHAFYEAHGGKTIIFARFIPIIRTFAPFIAGVSAMNIRLFSLFNIISAFIWIGSLLACGYYFGQLPFVQNNFTLVLYSIIAISLLPPFISFVYHKLNKSTSVAISR
jgi:membrane-associated protein